MYERSDLPCDYIPSIWEVRKNKGVSNSKTDSTTCRQTWATFRLIKQEQQKGMISVSLMVYLIIHSLTR